MNQRQAFLETIKVAREAGMKPNPGSPIGLMHLENMFQRISPSFSDAKLGRWLGWAQCAVVAADVGITLDDMKKINQRYS